MKIIPASKWGRVFSSKPPKAQSRKINELTVHYMGVPGPISATKAQIPGAIKRIQDNHMARKGENMSTIGYNFLIDKYARIWEGRGWDFRNGANGTESNDTSVSVCIMVGVKDNKLSPEVINAVQWLRAETERRHKKFLRRKLITARGHKDHKATSCPGPAIYKLIKNGTFMQAPTGETK
jgi:hypothetical protein